MLAPARTGLGSWRSRGHTLEGSTSRDGSLSQYSRPRLAFAGYHSDDLRIGDTPDLFRNARNALARCLVETDPLGRNRSGHYVGGDIHRLSFVTRSGPYPLWPIDRRGAGDFCLWQA